MKIRFGTGGNPTAFAEAGYKSSVDMPKYLRSLGLDAYEYECTKGVRISEKTATALGAAAIEHDIYMSLHGPYFISLSSTEEQKREQSTEYILSSLRAARAMGAKRIVVHSGSAAKITRETALEYAADTLGKTLERIREEELTGIHICLETMGKINQLGTLSEVLTLCKIDDAFMPAVDFGHLNARSMGALKTKNDYEVILNEIENRIGYDKLKVLHIHFSKIAYKEGGEWKHLTFEDTQYGPEFEPLAEVIAKKGLTPVIICESAGTQGIDALAMQNIMKEIGK